MYPTKFPRNHWYVAAQSHEVGPELLSRWLLGDPVCFYRRDDDAIVALVDRCIHRQLPLSKGVRLGNDIRCGYHGIRYGSDGRAVNIPSQDYVPPACRVRAYPIVERGGLVWIWMGDPDLAEESSVPDLPWLDSDGWSVSGGMLHMNARAQLLNENLLDLSHLTFLHPDSIGTDEVAQIPIKTEFTDDRVTVTRIMDDVDCPAFFTKVMHLSGRIDRTQQAEYLPPSVHVTHVSAKPAGEAGDENRCQHKVVHCITPERDNSAHYWFLVCRDYSVGDPEVDDLWEHGGAKVFAQDTGACEAIEQVISAYEPSYPDELNMKVDAGPLRARRILEQLIAAEQPAAEPVAASS